MDCSYCLRSTDSFRTVCCDGFFLAICESCQLPLFKYQKAYRCLPETLRTCIDPITIEKHSVFLLLDYGIISLIDVLGDESRVIKAARICTNTDASDKYDKHADCKLLERLIKLGHWTPFEHVVLTFEIQCPMFVWRQWVRHRTASINETSLRYTLSKPYFELNSITDSQELLERIDAFYNESYRLYKDLISNGVSKENARIVLPLATYTRALWTIDLRNLLHFLSLRLDKAAQFHIRLYAECIAKTLEKIFPNIMRVWMSEVLSK